MEKQKKHKLREELKESFQKAQLAIFADYKGLTATQADEFRKRTREVGVKVRVLKNNVARQAVKDGFGADAVALMDQVVGPTLVAFAYQDAAAAAKAVHQFAKENEALLLKDSLMGAKKIAASDIEALASLPSREVLLSMLLSTMNGPARGFVSVLAAVPRGLVTALSQIEKKKAGGE